MPIQRKGRKYLIEEVLPLIIWDVKPNRIIFDEDIINVSAEKLLTFLDKGIKCSECGIEGKYFVKERHIGGRGHEYFTLQLYAIDNQGEEILMTKDHIIPKCSGGINDISNYQTMCANCNNKKRNRLVK